MIQDFSYGIIPLIYHNNERHTILIRLASGNHRGLPKGHSEHDETPIESALREFYEETGISITQDQVDNTNTHTEQYEFFHTKKQQQIHKTVTYYTAKLPYIDPKLYIGSSQQNGEILDKKLVSLTQAYELATYQPTRNIISQIKKRLS